ncbi:hypothetical protein T265_05108 [Opisthorchis viverrini]|uniref:Leucine Rich repeat-containing domain protein n=1 Tax=Opisthorchis viverrini TaxID=6198 RepID=A0A074ZKW1_OPIVI|nr:hypothetical protein T265_05108 [Opisthorchis viverrini]KER27988.1 hypothetical protein T265_05108 [Opisthorchis viverrini]
MPPEGSPMTGILPGCQSVDREAGLKSAVARTLDSVCIDACSLSETCIQDLDVPCGVLRRAIEQRRLLDWIPVDNRDCADRLVVSENFDDDHLLEFHQRLTNLNRLDLTGCGWFADRHLLRFLEGTSLTHLDLSHCYRLFGGPPVCSKLASRLKLLSEKLSQLCPNLVHLGVCSVFTLTIEPRDESIQNQSLLTMIVESFPSLHSLNLSENTSLVEYVSWWINANSDSQILLPFFRTFMGSKMSRKGTTMELHLNRWPLACTHAMLIAADSLLTESTSSKFVLHFEHPFLLQDLTSSPKLVLQSSLRTAERKHSLPDKDPALSTAKNSRLI